MNGQDLFRGLEFVDPTMAEEAIRSEKRCRRPWRRYLVAAACVCFLLVGGTLAAEMLFGVQITGVFRGSEESGYQVLPELEPYPAENFSSPELTRALEEIRRQYREYRGEEDVFPGGYRFLGDTWADCEAFLGVSLPNPLETAAELTPLSSSALPLHLDTAHCSVNVTADARGVLQYVTLNTCYEEGEYKISLGVDFSMEGNAQDPGLRVFYDGTAAFAVDTYPMSDGQEAALLFARQEDMNYTKVNSYLVKADGIYTLSVWRSGTGHEADVREKLCELLDLF